MKWQKTCLFLLKSSLISGFEKERQLAKWTGRFLCWCLKILWLLTSLFSAKALGNRIGGSVCVPLETSKYSIFGPDNASHILIKSHTVIFERMQKHMVYIWQLLLQPRWRWCSFYICLSETWMDILHDNYPFSGTHTDLETNVKRESSPLVRFCWTHTKISF